MIAGYLSKRVLGVVELWRDVAVQGVNRSTIS